MAVSDWSTSAASNGSTLGIDIAEGCAAGNINGALREMMAQLKAAVANIPAGTKMPFAQTAAPTGWTKLTANDNSALRVVSGTAGSGGTVNFSSVFGASVSISGTTGGHALTEAELPSHFHSNGVTDVSPGTDFFNHGTVAASPTTSNNAASASSSGTVEGLTGSTGSGSAHTHSFTGSASIGAIKYVDVVICSRDA